MENTKDAHRHAGPKAEVGRRHAGARLGGWGSFAYAAPVVLMIAGALAVAGVPAPVFAGGEFDVALATASKVTGADGVTVVDRDCLRRYRWQRHLWFEECGLSTTTTVTPGLLLGESRDEIGRSGNTGSGGTGSGSTSTSSGGGGNGGGGNSGNHSGQDDGTNPGNTSSNNGGTNNPGGKKG